MERLKIGSNSNQHAKTVGSLTVNLQNGSELVFSTIKSIESGINFAQVALSQPETTSIVLVLVKS